MPRTTGKKRAAAAGPRGKAPGRPRGLPPPESIISVEEFKSPKSGKTYLAIETNQTDAYDKVGRDEGAPPPPAKKKKRGAASKRRPR